MEYKKIGTTIIARFDRGERVAEKLEELAKAENIKLAKISAIGAASEMTIGSYVVGEKKYYKNEYSGDFEILSLMGNITTKDGDFYPHMHITAGDEEGNVIGGHFNDALISVTCEMFIDVLDGSIDRQLDAETGINIFKF